MTLGLVGHFEFATLILFSKSFQETLLLLFTWASGPAGEETTESEDDGPLVLLNNLKVEKSLNFGPLGAARFIYLEAYA